jgi:hypothetical protein
MMRYGGTEVHIGPPFLTLALDVVSGQLHALATLPLEKVRPVPIGQ